MKEPWKSRWKRKVNGISFASTTKYHDRWTSGEAQLAEAFRGTHRELAQRLGRTFYAVEAFLRRNGITKGNIEIEEKD